MKKLSLILIVLLMGLAGNGRAQTVQTNEALLPVIELHDVPLPKAIDMVARLADFNYLLDPTLFPTVDAEGHAVKERSVSFRMENVNAKAVLIRLLELQHLVVREEPGSRIAIITRAGSALTHIPPRFHSATNEELGSLVEFRDTPMTTAIEYLSRSAGINFLIDSQVNLEKEPLINTRMTNVSAEDVLIRMLFVHGYVLMEDPVSNIAILTRTEQSTNRLFAGMSKTAIKPQWVIPDSAYTNEVIPLIQFSDVPITTAIENLARQGCVNYMLDYKLGRRWWNSPSAGGIPEPLINLRLEHVTAWNTLNRLLNAHNLVIVDNPITQIWQVRGADEPAYHLDAGLLGLDTNSLTASTNGLIPLIQFSDVSLREALESLIKFAALPVVLDPRFKDNRSIVSQMSLSLRWENLTVRQAIIALCQNYDLNIVKDATTGSLRIGPRTETK